MHRVVIKAVGRAAGFHGVGQVDCGQVTKAHLEGHALGQQHAEGGDHQGRLHDRWTDDADLCWNIIAKTNKQTKIKRFFYANEKKNVTCLPLTITAPLHPIPLMITSVPPSWCFTMLTVFIIYIHICSHNTSFSMFYTATYLPPVSSDICDFDCCHLWVCSVVICYFHNVCFYLLLNSNN